MKDGKVWKKSQIDKIDLLAKSFWEHNEPTIIPEIAETKIQGLKKFYGVSSKEGLEFFEAHKSADVVHRAECEKLLDGLSKEEKEKAEKASLLTAKFLWNFLSGMTAKHKLEQVAA